MQFIFTPDESGTKRGAGFATVEYSSDAEDETVVETTKADLASIFETAKSNGETLDGADASIDAAVNAPLAYLDYLILDSTDSIVFDSEHVRQTPTSG